MKCYTKNSRIINDVIKFIGKLDKNGQRKFLTYEGSLAFPTEDLRLKFLN